MPIPNTDPVDFEIEYEAALVACRHAGYHESTPAQAIYAMDLEILLLRDRCERQAFLIQER